MDDKTRAWPADPLAAVALSDRFDLTKSPVLLNGAQAVARLLLAQKERDRRAGLNTGGFVTGYRGSPVGGLDLQFARLAELFKANDIHFEPGLNEELAATAVWGTQQAEMRGEGKYRRRLFAVVRQGARGRPLAATCSATPILPEPRPVAGFSP